jgi:hypothetical protein
MTQNTESIVMEPVADLVSFGSGGNAKPVGTSIPEAMRYEVKKLHITFN